MQALRLISFTGRPHHNPNGVRLEQRQTAEATDDVVNYSHLLPSVCLRHLVARPLKEIFENQSILQSPEGATEGAVEALSVLLVRPQLARDDLEQPIAVGGLVDEVDGPHD